jgi:septal ring-binding cell division protein DamX
MAVPSEGKVSTAAVAAIVANLIRAKATGTMRFERQSVIKVLYLKGGMLAYASSNEERDRLGSVLIRAGKLTQDQLDLATSKVETGKTLGKTLTELGFITPDELLTAAKQQVEDIFTSLFNWKDGSFEWLEGKLPDGLVDLRMPGPAALLKGVFAVEDRELVVRELGGHDAVYNFTDSFMDEYEQLSLPEDVDSVIAGIDGQRSVRELARMSREEFRACQVIYFCKLYQLVRAVRGVSPQEDVPTVKKEAPPSPPSAPAAKPSPVSSPPTPPPISPSLQTWLAQSKAEKPAPAVDLPLKREPEKTARDIKFDPLTLKRPAASTLSPEVIFSKDEKFTPVFATPPKTNDGLAGLGKKLAVVLLVIALLSAAAMGVQHLLKRKGISVTEMLGMDGKEKGGMQTLTLKTEPAEKAPAPAPESAKAEPPQTLDLGAALPAPGPASSETGTPPEGGTASAPFPGTKTQSQPPGAMAESRPAAPFVTPPKPDEGKAEAPLSTAPVAKTAEAPVSKAAPETKAAPPPAEAANTGAPTPAPAAAPVSALPFPNDTEARRLLVEGRFADAAKTWKKDITGVPSSRYTVLLAIMCEESSVRKAASEQGKTSAFFILPMTFKGRSCYRAAWGIYRTRDEAEKAYQSMPAYFREMSHKPVIGSAGALK